MRFLLSLLGALALACVGWIFWRATERSRDWREFVALGVKKPVNNPEWGRFHELGRRLFPGEADSPHEVTVLDGPEGRRRVLAIVILRDQGGRHARLLVLDESGDPLGSCRIPTGPCGVGCRARPDRGPWAFDIEKQTPGSPILAPYRLVDDRPVPLETP